MRCMIAVAAMCMILCAVPIQAQAPQAPPKPGPETARLAYFVGTWKTEGDLKPSSFGPGGKFTSTDKAEWMQGGFFLVTHSDGTTPMGPYKELSVMGYDPNEKVYTYHAFNSMGEATTSKGTVQGDTWNWANEEKMGSTTVKVRVTIKEVSKTEYTFKLEMSQNGGAWSTVVEATSRKAAPASPEK